MSTEEPSSLDSFNTVHQNRVRKSSEMTSSDGKGSVPATASGNSMSGEVEWLAGQSVTIVCMAERPELEGRSGTIVDADMSGDGMLLVRVHMPNLERTIEAVPPSALILGGDDSPIQVSWTYIRRLNTGMRGGLAEVMADAYAMDMDEESAVRQIECTVSELHDFMERMQFVRHPTTLLKRLGLHVGCYAFAFDASDRGQGQDNVVASHLAMGEDGCATPAIVGTSFFVRFSATSGEAVDFPHSEAIRTLMFLNDMSSLFDAAPGNVLSSSLWDTLTACFPYYEEGCRMLDNGFVGMRSMKRQADGSFVKDPEDMEPALAAA